MDDFKPEHSPGEMVLVRGGPDRGHRVEVHAVNDRDGVTYYWLIFPDRTLRIYRADEVD